MNSRIKVNRIFTGLKLTYKIIGCSQWLQTCTLRLRWRLSYITVYCIRFEFYCYARVWYFIQWLSRLFLFIFVHLVHSCSCFCKTPSIIVRQLCVMGASNISLQTFKQTSLQSWKYEKLTKTSPIVQKFTATWSYIFFWSSSVLCFSKTAINGFIVLFPNLFS